jgi:hypothetical protein
MHSRKIRYRTRQVSFRVSSRIYDEIYKLAKEAGFKNVSRYWQGLGIEAISSERWKRRVHAVTNADPNDRDYLIDWMLKFPVDAHELVEWLKTHESGESPIKKSG